MQCSTSRRSLLLVDERKEMKEKGGKMRGRRERGGRREGRKEDWRGREGE